MTSTPWSAAGMSRSVSPATAWSPTTWQRMRMLYKPEAFEPLTETSWDEAAVRAHVEKIADEHEALLRRDRPARGRVPPRRRLARGRPVRAGEEPGDEERPRLAEVEARVAVHRRLEARVVVRLSAPGLESARGDRSGVVTEPRERPRDSGRPCV